MSKSGSRLLRNLRWLNIGNVIQIGLSGCYTILLAVTLPIEEFGYYSIILGACLVVNSFLDPQLHVIGSKYLWGLMEVDGKDHRNELSKQIGALYNFEMLLKLYPLLLIPLVVWFYTEYADFEESYAAIFVVSLGAYYFLKVGSGLTQSVLRNTNRPDIIVFGLVIELVVRITICLFLTAYNLFSLQAACAVFFATGIALNGIQFVYVHRLLGKMGISLGFCGLTEIRDGLKKSQSMIKMNFVMSWADLMSKDLDVIILPFIGTISDVSIYKLAKTISTLVWKVMDPIHLALMPEAARWIEQKEYTKLTLAIKKIMIFAPIICFALAVCLQLVLFMFRDAVSNYGYAGIERLVLVMSLAICISSFFIYAYPCLVAFNRLIVALYISFFTSILGVILLFILTNNFGVFGTALAWGTAFGLNVVAMGIYVHWKLRHDQSVSLSEEHFVEY